MTERILSIRHLGWKLIAGCLLLPLGAAIRYIDRRICETAGDE